MILMKEGVSFEMVAVNEEIATMRAADERSIGLWAQILEDKRVHGSWDRAGFHAVAVHRFGVWRKNLPLVLRAPVTLLYYMMNFVIRSFYGIEMASTTKIGRRLLIPHQGGIVIHYRSEVGDDCTILQNVTIGAVPGQAGVPKIGNRVYISAGAVIVGDLTIGDDAKIGPNAVILSNVPAGAIAISAPARIIPQVTKSDPNSKLAG